MTRKSDVLTSVSRVPEVAIPRLGTVLPRPDQPFRGFIESTPDFPQAVQAPKGVPNILLILTDDVGFGATSPYGGPIPTATFDRLAQAGLLHPLPYHCSVLAHSVPPSCRAAITTRPPPAWS